jgi:uncharacterized protein (TIGR00369 family)
MRVALREVGAGDDDIRVEGVAPAADYLRGPHGGVRAGALLTMLDNAGGMCGGLAALPEGWVVSTNLAARTVPDEHVGPFRVSASVLRRGRNNVVAAVEVHDDGAGGRFVADGVLTSAILIPENGPPAWSRPFSVEPGPPLTEPVPSMPDWIGARVESEDTVAMNLVDDLRNPWGILHGGVVLTLVDLAAAHVASGVTADVVAHFLAPNRIGPVRASARRIGTRSDGEVVRVEVRDDGASRVTAIAVVTVRRPG